MEVFSYLSADFFLLLTIDEAGWAENTLLLKSRKYSQKNKFLHKFKLFCNLHSNCYYFIIDKGINMFTLEQIQAAHSKVKSGADFPTYIQEIQKIGVNYYEVFVSDGHADYFGANNFKITSSAKYEAKSIALDANTEQFITDLKAHQSGKTDYLTFCSDCAKSGIEKWAIIVDRMICTYYDINGNNILEEAIPH